MKSALETLASISRDMEVIFDSNLRNLSLSPSKAMLHLTLLYHQVRRLHYTSSRMLLLITSMASVSS